MSEWLVEDAGGLKMGRKYLVFKKFFNIIKKRGYKNLNGVDELLFNEKVSEYDSSLKWGRKEW